MDGTEETKNETVESPVKSPGVFDKLFGSSRKGSTDKTKGFRFFRSKSEVESGGSGLGNYKISEKRDSTPFEDEETSKTKSEEGVEGKEELPGEGEEEEKEQENQLESTMRNVLRKLNVEVEDDDDWKNMVVKTRLHLQDLKTNFTGEGKTNEERTAKLNIPLGTENMLEIQFRLDFAHYTPAPSEAPEDEDEITIQPDLAIKQAQKLNKRRLARLVEKQKEKEQQDTEEEGDNVEAGDGDEEQEEANENTYANFIEEIEEGTGIKISVDTDKLEDRWAEYREIFFGAELTEEEKEKLQKMKSDDKEFYIHLKFIVRKKTPEERAQDEEEEAEEEDADEDIELDPIDEKKEARRKDLEKERKSGTESGSVP